MLLEPKAHIVINKVLLLINAALFILSLWTHRPGWALLAAICAYINILTINQMENLNDQL